MTVTWQRRVHSIKEISDRVLCKLILAASVLRYAEYPFLISLYFIFLQMQGFSAIYKKFSILFPNILYLGKLNFFTSACLVLYNNLK